MHSETHNQGEIFLSIQGTGCILRVSFWIEIRKQAPCTAEAVTLNVDTHTQDAWRGRKESRRARRQPSRRRRRARSTQRCGVCARHTAAYGTWAPWPMRARPQVPRQGRAPLQRQRHDRPGLAFVLTLRRVWQSGTCSRVVLRCTLTNEAHIQRSVRETYDVLSSPWRWRRSPRLIFVLTASLSLCAPRPPSPVCAAALLALEWMAMLGAQPLLRWR